MAVSEIRSNVNRDDIKVPVHSLIPTPNFKSSLQSPVMTFYNPSAQSRHRSRSYSLSQPTQMGYPYPTTSTPYSAYNSLPPTQFDPGYNTNQTFYVAPSISGRSRGRSRSRSRSRPAHGHSHGHGHSHSQRRSRSHNRHHGHQRRSHSTTSHRLQRPSHHVRFSMSKTERSAQVLCYF